jgi:orotidine 5'-phosphate decarboxylase subfamily 1
MFTKRPTTLPNPESYEGRASVSKTAAAKALFNLMATKKTNLSVAADVTTKADFLKLADQVGPYICVLKTHIDVIEDFDQDLIVQLKALATKHNFIIFEDRKFADIGNTVELQYAKGIYRIADWAGLTDAHTVPGPGVIEGLRKVGLPLGRGLILLAEMSTKGNLATGAYTKASTDMAIANSDFVMGFISMKQLVTDKGFINFTPGIQFGSKTDLKDQQYKTPEEAIAGGSDVLIVGRGIYQAKDPAVAAQQYQAAGWKAYEERLNPTPVATSSNTMTII